MASQKPNSKSEKAAPKSVKKSVSISTANFSRWYPIIIVLLSVLLYSRTIHYQYVKMDDTDLIVENEVFIKHLKNLPQAFKQSCFEIPGQLTDNKSYYRPILIVSFMIDAQVHGVRSSGTYHFFNLLYHIIACILLYYLLLKLNVNKELALVLSLIFALHPANVHAVSWIPGRNDILLAIFTLLSFSWLIDYYRSNDSKFLALHLLAFALALFTKESGILLLILYFLFMLLWERDALFYKRKILLPIGYLAISLIWFFARRAVMHGQESLATGGSLVPIIIKNLPYLFLYIGKVLLPVNLNVMPGVNAIAIVLGVVSFASLAVLFYFIKDRRKAIFSIFWFFLLLAPTLLVPELPAYEHRDYLPLIGLMLGISQVSFLITYAFPKKKTTYAFIAISVIYFIISSLRVPVFANRVDFWTDGTEGTPFVASACINVGQLYQQNFEHEKDPNALKLAGEWTKKGLDEDSTTLRGNNNYGAFLYFNGKKDEAAKYFQKEIKFHPTNSDPYKNMGIYYREKGEPEKSVYYWKKLISMNRYYLDAYQELANYYKQIGDMKNSTLYATEGQQLSDESEAKYNKLK